MLLQKIVLKFCRITEAVKIEYKLQEENSFVLMQDGTVWIDIRSYLQTKYISINQDEKKKWDFVLETFLIMATEPVML